MHSRHSEFQLCKITSKNAWSTWLVIWHYSNEASIHNMMFSWPCEDTTMQKSLHYTSGTFANHSCIERLGIGSANGNTVFDNFWKHFQPCQAHLENISAIYLHKSNHRSPQLPTHLHVWLSVPVSVSTIFLASAVTMSSSFFSFSLASPSPFSDTTTSGTDFSGGGWSQYTRKHLVICQSQ